MAKSKAGWSRSLLAAALVAAGFPPFGIWPLTFVGFVVFLIPFFEEVFFAKENKSRLKSRESAQYFAFFSFFNRLISSNKSISKFTFPDFKPISEI